jgi:tetrapyrrole methylase family protein/MazG family protein
LTLTLLRGAGRRFVRTLRHPAAEGLSERVGPVESLDRAYEAAATFDEAYRRIVRTVLDAAVASAAAEPGTAPHDGAPAVVYAVPGSPLVAERTVELLRAAPEVELDVVPALSFLDLAWARLGVDPLAAGVRLVDGTDFAPAAAGDRGPLLVAQVHSEAVLSAVKLAVEEPPPGARAVLLHHLGLPDEVVVEVAWSELDRTLAPDHLTSLWIPALAAPVAAELVRMEELVRTLRQRCPWDRRQTHASLGRHLLEESYETLDAIDAVAQSEPDPSPGAVAHLEEELGDLLFQVFFHAVLGAEEGRFTLADIARGLHDKLVGRHPHVFGDVEAETPEEVAANWEVLKQAEKGRASVFDGIPAALPALALSAKLQRKAQATGVVTLPDLPGRLAQLRQGVAALEAAATRAEGDAPSAEIPEADPAAAAQVGDLLFALADAARLLGVDPETALRARAADFRRRAESNS